MKIQVYRATATKDFHIQTVSDFHTGILNQGDSAELIKGEQVDTTADAYVIFGSWKDRDRPWHRIKMQIIESKKPFIVIETPIIGREIRNDHPHYRIGINHYVRHLGYFNNHNRTPKRWEKMQAELGLEVKPWREDGKYILLCLQLPGDASLLGADITKWALQTIRQIREITDRPIRVRPHPIYRQYDEDTVAVIKKQKRVEWVAHKDQRPLETDLSEAWCTVTYTSGVGVDSILAGIPVVGCHPGNFAYPLSSTIKDVEQPRMPNRQQWCADIAYVQWSLDEIRQGKPWNHLKSELQRLLSE